jgi:dethiobiotin synthetase
MILSDSAKPLRGVFVTGTDTEVGKTIVAGAIAATLAQRGERVAVFKPAVTGLDELGGTLPDHELLRRSAGSRQRPEGVSPYRFGPPLSPHLAAHLASTRIDPALLVTKARHAARNATALVVEGVGGLMVPLTPHYLIRDFALDLRMPLVVVARAGLGTINHTLLTVDVARSVGLDVASIVLTPWPERPNAMELSNRMTIAERTRLPVYSLPNLKVTHDGVEPLGDELANSLLEPLPSPAARPLVTP